MNALSVVILAAGEGVRMGSNVPKPLMEVMGKPMLQRVVESCQGLSPDIIVVVVGSDAVEKEAARLGCDTAWQRVPLGTADALNVALDKCMDKGDILVTCSDIPLVTTEILSNLYRTHRQENNYMTLLSSRVSEPYGYGRVVKDKDTVVKIVEEKEADVREKEINLINSGICCLKRNKLEGYLSLIEKSPAKGEYYLTDLVAIFNKNRLRVGEVECDYRYIQGVNTPGQLEQVRNKLNA